jgi:hypothetical protein
MDDEFSFRIGWRQTQILPEKIQLLLPSYKVDAPALA